MQFIREAARLVDMFRIQALQALFDGPEDWAWPIDRGAYSTQTIPFEIKEL